MKLPDEPVLLAIVGPTATGKSSLALGIAKELPGEIINCDSMQLVRGMDIGTSKPSLADRAVTPHHLYDHIDPDQWYSAGQYMVESRAICREIAGRDRIAMVVGGTGLYLRALLQGVFEGPSRSQKYRRHLDQVMARGGSARLYSRLSEVDPVAAERIQAKDTVRIVRALEVYHQTGLPISDLQVKRRPLTGFRVVKIGLCLDRKTLYDRIGSRVRSMFRAGLLEEVQGIMDQGFSPDCKGFEAIGYRQAVSCLTGNISLEEAVEKTSRDTRRYAKRQMTWFRGESDLDWVEAPGESRKAVAQALEHVMSTSDG